jgi:hypothetical protein
MTTRINILKEIIYTELKSVFLKDPPPAAAVYNLFYGYYEGTEEIFATYQIFSIEDEDNIIDERDMFGLQVMITVKTSYGAKHTSVKCDNLIQATKDKLKLFNATKTVGGVRHRLRCLLPQMATPALYNHDKEEWIGIIRFTGLLIKES